MESILLADLSMESDQGENETLNLGKNMTDVDPGPSNQAVPELLQEEEDATRVRIAVGGEMYLELMQYIDSRGKRGVSSIFWDGGLGLLRYISDFYGHDWKHVTVLDIGAGTGLVGIGTAAASQGQAVVAVTGTLQTMPLLYSNIKMNRKNWAPYGESSYRPPEARVLEWGQPISKEWIRLFLDRGSLATTGEDRTIIVTGADVVNRKSLFGPLLATLCELTTRVREFTDKRIAKLECLLAVQSTCIHLDHFWETARKNGLSMERIAIVELDKEDKFKISNASVQLLDEQHCQLPPVTNTKRCDGVLWIVRLRKVPYTFII